MLKGMEVQQRFSQIENLVHQATQICDSAPGTPQDLKECIHELDQEAGQIRQSVLQSQDERRIVESVDHMEETGDRAKEACQQAGNIDSKVRNAVMQAHKAISDLKHQLH
ncbi:MAG: hypothetical protein HGA47_07945 [Zoogloea sp.]|nr:hypothetical protein [Zoogloea sp.]